MLNLKQVLAGVKNHEAKITDRDHYFDEHFNAGDRCGSVSMDK